MSMETCNEWESNGLLYLYNELDSEMEVIAYREHLQRCIICQENLKNLESIRKFIELETPSESCIGNIVQKAHQQIYHEPVHGLHAKTESASSSGFRLRHWSSYPPAEAQEWSLPTALDRIFMRLVPVAVTAIIFVLFVAKMHSYRSLRPLKILQDSRVELLSGFDQKLESFVDEKNIVYLELKNIGYKLVELTDELERLEEL